MCFVLFIIIALLFFFFWKKGCCCIVCFWKVNEDVDGGKVGCVRFYFLEIWRCFLVEVRCFFCSYSIWLVEGSFLDIFGKRGWDRVWRVFGI